jgi:hypothetical protein
MSKKLGESEKVYTLRQMERQGNLRGEGEALKRWNEIKERRQQNRRRRLNEYQRHGERADALTTPLSTSFSFFFFLSNSPRLQVQLNGAVRHKQQ